VKRIYIAGPYTRGDAALNVRRALAAAETLRTKGWFPFIPHLYHFWHFVFPHPYDYWMEMDLSWLETCDAILRLPGKSAGADDEVARAEDLCMPVYRSVCKVPDLYELSDED
jgi:hypothetical protein